VPDRPINPWHGKKVASSARRSMPAPLNARALALRALLAFSRDGTFVARTLDELFHQHQTPVRERRLATELAAETVRRSLSLETILSRYVTRPRDAVEPDLWWLLQLGVCQLLCLRHIPVHAAVHETVSLCEELGKPRAKGFINGTLRSIEREVVHSCRDSDHADEAPLTDLLESCTVDQLRPHQWPVVIPQDSQLMVHRVELAREVFASAVHDPILALSQVSSLPEWLMQRWQAQMNDLDRVLRLALWFTTPGRMALRVNLQRASREEVLSALEEAGIPGDPGELPESIRLPGTAAVADLPLFRDGGFSVQDESAMGAARLLDPHPGESILDLCAAPGGKTCHLAELLQGTGRVVACDVAEDRLRTIDHNVRRLQLQNVQIWGMTPEGEPVPPGPFDAVLVDVPCSNTGVLGKRPEARWRLTPASFLELIPLQRRLLSTALKLVRPGGRVVYSTCSIDREENSDVVQQVLAEHPEIQLVSEAEHWPGVPADGGYQALLRRSH